MAQEIPRRKKIEAARQMRENSTPGEAKLWSRLRNRRAGGFKFRRQQPLGEFFADFFCAEARLILEIDGSIHQLKSDNDAARTDWLQKGGLEVLRFSNEAVLSSTDSVVAQIVLACRQRVSKQRSE